MSETFIQSTGTEGSASAADIPELIEFRRVGRELWPFVKVFGLCGAHPKAIQAVADLAKLLKIESDSGNGGGKSAKEAEIAARAAAAERPRIIAEVLSVLGEELATCQMLHRQREQVLRSVGKVK